jgi:hypothetical protein
MAVKIKEAMELQGLEKQLNHFDQAVREKALHEINGLVESGQIGTAPVQNAVNMHCHTFFSFNGYGYSPCALAWLAKKQGYQAIGIVDFDTLDGVDEFLHACEVLGVRGSAGIETRTYLPEFSERVINSPGEPGVSYVMGVGFASAHVPDEAAPILRDLQSRARNRNQIIVERVNAFLDPVTIDYEQDVISLTPGGNVTERHIVLAYVHAARRKASNIPAFWAQKLALPLEKIKPLMGDLPKFQDTIRSKLMKKGGVGYITPTPDTFPALEEVNQLITACGAIPTIAWLDGTTPGEKDAEELFSLLMVKGAAVLNIIPDRNWNIENGHIKREKLANLYAVVDMARQLNLPLNVGTEMNRFDSPKIDAFDADELQPVRQDFLDGAHFIYGHTMMQRHLGMGYQSTWAQRHFQARKTRNQFYQALGYALPPGKPGVLKLNQIAPGSHPSSFLVALS